MLIQIFKSVLLMSAVGSLLALFWLFLKPVTRKLFSPKWQYYIWLTVLIVMVMPVSFSLPQKEPDVTTVTQVQNISMNTETTAQTDNQGAAAPLRRLLEVSPLKRINLPQSTMLYLSAVWLLGTIFVFLMKTVKYYLFLRAIHKNSSIDDSHANIPKRLRVRRTETLDVPLIVGLVKPTLFLPNKEISENDMNYILMHEMTHYKRHDLLYKWAAALVQSVHWFNPLVYIVSGQIELECEVSCDFAVTSKLSEAEQNNYMNMILCLLSNSQSRLRPLTTQMASNKITLKRRFAMIKNKKRFSKFAVIISAVIAVIILSIAVFTSGLLSDFAADVQTSDCMQYLNADRVDGVLGKDSEAVLTIFNQAMNGEIPSSVENIVLSKEWLYKESEVKIRLIFENDLLFRIEYDFGSQNETALDFVSEAYSLLSQKYGISDTYPTLPERIEGLSMEKLKAEGNANRYQEYWIDEADLFDSIIPENFKETKRVDLGIILEKRPTENDFQTVVYVGGIVNNIDTRALTKVQ